MLRFRIGHRLLLVAGVLFAAFVLLSAADLGVVRSTVFQERQAKTHDMVQTAVKLIAEIDKRVKAQGGTTEQAQESATTMLRAMRWGDGDYYGVYRYDGMTLVHGNPKNEGVNRLGYSDRTGKHLIADIIATARAGGGIVGYSVPRATGGPELPKTSSVAAYEPWQWAVQAGVYVDDVDTMTLRQTLQVGMVTLAFLALSILAVVLIARSVTSPLNALQAAMVRLAEGHRDTEIPGVVRRDEIGGMARAVLVFRDQAREIEAMRAEQEATRLGAEALRKREHQSLADEIGQKLGNVATGLAGSAAQLETTAMQMSGTAKQTDVQAGFVRKTTEQTTSNVQAVATAIDQLSFSVEEIGRKVSQSASKAREAADQARRADAVVRALVAATSRIGNIVGLIGKIAGQTNLLALNATIEAARAGEAGQGFAIVAGEVKNLVRQTTEATSQIETQVSQVAAAVGEAMAATSGIVASSAEMEGIAAAISVAVEQQGIAAVEIARNTRAVAQGTDEVTSAVSQMTVGASNTGAAASQVLGAAAELLREAEQLRYQVQGFEMSIRAA